MRSEEIRKANQSIQFTTVKAKRGPAQDMAIMSGILSMLSEIAAQLAERNERECGKVADRQKTPSPTDAPPEDFPVRLRKPIAQAQEAYIQGTKSHGICGTDSCCSKGMTAAAQVIVRALQAEIGVFPIMNAAIEKAARNLGLEVRE